MATPGRAAPDPILSTLSVALLIGGAITVHEFGWRWYLVLGLVVAFLALRAWRRPHSRRDPR